MHKSVQALEKDIRAWIENWNENPRPFAWTKTAEEILDSSPNILRGFQAEDTSGSLLLINSWVCRLQPLRLIYCAYGIERATLDT